MCYLWEPQTHQETSDDALATKPRKCHLMAAGGAHLWWRLLLWRRVVFTLWSAEVSPEGKHTGVTRMLPSIASCCLMINTKLETPPGRSGHLGGLRTRSSSSVSVTSEAKVAEICRHTDSSSTQTCEEVIHGSEQGSEHGSVGSVGSDG